MGREVVDGLHRLLAVAVISAGAGRPFGRLRTGGSERVVGHTGVV